MAEVVVVVGVRGFGLACARRLGVGRDLLIADVDAGVLAQTEQMLAGEGYRVTGVQVDVSDRASVDACAERARSLGELRVLVHTAGISPAMAPWERIFAVNLIGTIHVLDAFGTLAGPGSVGIVMASNAANYTPVPPEIETELAIGPIDGLREVVQRVPGHDTGLGAYWLAKRSNQLRVQALAGAWGAKGARILSVSPGIIATPMIAYERSVGSPVDATAAGTPSGRMGTSEDIAAAVAWLAGPEASFITGTDLLVDGGMIAALRWANLTTADPSDDSRQTRPRVAS